MVLVLQEQQSRKKFTPTKIHPPPLPPKKNDIPRNYQTNAKNQQKNYLKNTQPKNTKNRNKHKTQQYFLWHP